MTPDRPAPDRPAVDADRRRDDQLLVNFCAPRGRVRVALADKSGDWHGALRHREHLDGFSFDDCVPLSGDHVRAPVRFRNAKITDIPPDTPLTVRFELTRAEVFAYEWAP